MLCGQDNWPQHLQQLRKNIWCLVFWKPSTNLVWNLTNHCLIFFDNKIRIGTSQPTSHTWWDFDLKNEKKNIKSSVHRPGIEPGSREWESRMITITPTVPLVYNRKNGCIWKFVFALLNSGDYVFVSKLLSSCWNQSMLDEFYVKLKSRLRFRPVSIERVSEVSKIRSLRILRTCK